MSLSLTLLPLSGRQEMAYESVLCYDRLDFDQDYRIFGQLAKFYESDDNPTIKAHQIPPQMWVKTYDDLGITRRRADLRGDELTFVLAQELKKLTIPADASPKNKAIKAFVDALPDDTPIILFWG